MYRVLACGEFSELVSGYGVYMKELLTRLSRTPGVEVAELASFCNPEDPRVRNVKWQIFPVEPPRSNQEAMNRHESNHFNKFGQAVFNDVLLAYKPTHVFDIRDVWNFEFELRSPFRDFYSHIIMPAVDAVPQHKTWIDMYSSADMVLSYTDWGIDVLKEAGIKNTYKCVSPCSGSEFKKIPDEEIKRAKLALGLGDIKIVGTVMRNQRRKLYPDLFRDFKKYIDTHNVDDTYLLCHTSNPDTWELDDLLIEHKVQGKVLFTYSCPNCGTTDISFYRGTRVNCKSCNFDKARMSSTNFGISNSTLNVIFNMMDVYVQYATNEGYGMPMAEAIACEVPVMGVNYSAMSEIIDKSNSTPIEVKALYREPESFRNFACPDSDDFVEKLHQILSSPKEERLSKAKFSNILYGMRSYDDIAKIWLEAFSKTKPKLSWDSGNRFNPDVGDVPMELSNADFARWLILKVLQDPTKVGSYMEARLIRDLDNGYCPRGFDNKYYFETSDMRGHTMQDFNKRIAVHHFASLLEEKIVWENRRCGK